MSAEETHEEDVLSEPALSTFLRVVRRELALTLTPELISERSRSVAELVQLTLDHLIAREEALPALDRAFKVVQSESAKELKALRPDAGDGDFEAQVKQLAHTPHAFRRDNPGWMAVRRVVEAERSLHNALEQAEKDAAALCVAPEDRPALDVVSLQSYLNRRFKCDGIKVMSLDIPVGGFSKDTFIARLSGEGRPADGIVIRCDMKGGPLETLATSEWGVMQAMRQAGVPVAEPLWVEFDVEALGRSFIAVKHVTGRQLMNLKLDFLGDDSKGCMRELARVLAAIHCVDPTTAGLEEGFVRQPLQAHILYLLDQFEDQWLRRRRGPSPTVAAGFQWMRSNIPVGSADARIVHGDATVRNMLFENVRATAMLDWETWHLGDPGEDLAYCRGEVERFLPWHEFLAEYVAAGGPPPSEESLRYWGMWMYLRGVVTSVSQMDRLVEEPPPDVRPAFGGPHFVRFCVRKVADYLLEL